MATGYADVSCAFSCYVMQMSTLTTLGAPGPPETAEEVLPIIRKKLKAGKHIVGSDASKGLASTCKSLKVAAATARHSLSEFTPVHKLKKKNMSYRALKSLKRSGGKKSCSETKTSVTMVGGDQVAESHIASRFCSHRWIVRTVHPPSFGHLQCDVLLSEIHCMCQRQMQSEQDIHRPHLDGSAVEKKNPSDTREVL